MNPHLRGLRGTTFAVVTALLAFTTLAGCSGGDASDSGSVHGGGGNEPSLSGGDAAAKEGGAADYAQAEGAVRADAPASPVKNADLLEPRALIKTGSVNLRAKDVGQVVADITGIVTAHRGEIASESTT
ncbi:MAG: hypothetical protein H0U36_04780, partial [Nocardioidaceae bacterium]|nr:hypothetical protein [Nocardioidaceae bacterium]